MATLQVVVGTYEGSLAGWASSAEEPSSLALRFAFSAHDQPIRAVAVDTKFGALLATGSGDESIRCVQDGSGQGRGRTRVRGCTKGAAGDGRVGIDRHNHVFPLSVLRARRRQDLQHSQAAARRSTE